MTQTAAEKKPQQISKFIVIIRPEFMAFCEDACRAATFNHLLFRLAGKCKDQPKEDIRAGEVLWHSTTEEITSEMSDAWSEWKVCREVNALFDLGLLGRKRNPTWGADRTKHFCFGREQCAKLLELCKEHSICVRHLDLPKEVTHLICSALPSETSIKCTCGKEEQMGETRDANGENTKCKLGIPQMQMRKTQNANEENTRAIYKETYKETNKETDKEESVPTIAAPPPGADAPRARSSSISEKESGSQRQAPTQENQQPVTVRKDAAEKKPARANKPAMDEATQKHVDAVYEALDEFKRKATGKPHDKYQRHQTDTDAIVTVLLPQNPTPRSLFQVCKDMWEEKDRNGNHFWQKHMRPHNICNQYESRIMAIEGKDRLEIPDPEKPRTTVSGYQDYTPAPGAPLQQFRPLARARR